jgi:hypothetical protein
MQKVPTAESKIYDRMHEEMIPLIRDHTVVISAWYNGQLKQHATGTLIQFSDRHFLVTAAHAIEDFDNAKSTYPDIELLIDNGNANDLVTLYGNYHATEFARDSSRPSVRLSDERDDFWDIGLWELDQLTVDRLTNKRFLNRSSISLNANLTDGVFFLAGCPCAWASADVEAKSAYWKWIRYISHPFPDTTELPNFDDRFHMALRLGSENPQLPENLVGISGCSIWRLSDVPAKENWDVSEARIVAVQTCVYPRAIRGTKWQWVVPVLTNMVPVIEKVFNKLWLPA